MPVHEMSYQELLAVYPFAGKIVDEAEEIFLCRNTKMEDAHLSVAVKPKDSFSVFVSDGTEVKDIPSGKRAMDVLRNPEWIVGKWVGEKNIHLEFFNRKVITSASTEIMPMV